MERHRTCVALGYKAYGGGSPANHVNGRLGELVFPGWFDGSDPDPDYTWERDIARGKADFIDKQGRRWGIRTRRHKDDPLIIKPNDPYILYAQINTSRWPVLSVDGWYTKQEAEDKHQLHGMDCDPSRKIWEIPIGDLHPFLPRQTD